MEPWQCATPAISATSAISQVRSPPPRISLLSCQCPGHDICRDRRTLWHRKFGNQLDSSGPEGLSSESRPDSDGWGGDIDLKFNFTIPTLKRFRAWKVRDPRRFRDSYRRSRFMNQRETRALKAALAGRQVSTLGIAVTVSVVAPRLFGTSRGGSDSYIQT